MSYSFSSRVRFSEIGEDRKLTVGSMINYFQDCSNFHSTKVDLGLEILEKRKKAWVLSAWQVDISSRPGMGEEIIISTWPYDFKGFYGYRNFVIQTKTGIPIAHANSIWVYLDIETGMPARIIEEEVVGYQIEPRLNMEYAPRKISIPGTGVAQASFTVRRHDLDLYHHVNNGKYIQMAGEYLPPRFEIKQLRAEYKNQAILGSVIKPFVTEEQGIYTVVLADEEGSAYAVVEFR